MSLEPAVLGQSPKDEAVHVPYAPLYDDLYHTVAGAWVQARQVFIEGNLLPARWQRRQQFVILETGFGLGNNFLATWSAWRQDPQRCQHLIFISIEKHPLLKADLARVHGLPPDDADQAERHLLASRLLGAWPTLTPGMHTLHFDEAQAPDEAAQAPARISLMLGLGDIATLLPAMVASVDAFYLDGFSPAKNPQMWDTELLSRLHRLAAPGATAATWTVARPVRDALVQAGFRIERLPGIGSKRDMVRAHYEPRYTPPRQAGGWWPAPADPEDHHAIVLGAGLAGCSAALALCRQGWRVTLIDQHDGPALAASGNPGGLFHSIVHGDDGIHARAHRAAALSTWRMVKGWIAGGQLRGSADGLLRLDHNMTADQAHALIERLRLPTDHVQWLDQAAARQLAGIPVPSGGWLFRQAGWLHPAGLARLMLDEAAPWRDAQQASLRCLWGQAVDQITALPDGRWQVRHAGQDVATASTLVLCHAQASPGLLQTLPADQAVAPLPLSLSRGQITSVNALPDGAHMPHLAVAGSGYALPLSAQTLLCGATNQPEDNDPSVRAQDHRHNLAQAASLGVWSNQHADEMPLDLLQGRTAWRAMTPDRLPLIGALPWSAERLTTAGPNGRRLDQVRLLPRQRGEHGGLYALTGLGSRGITWSALAGELLAHWVTGTPCPVEADLRDALDPARFVVRQITRGR